ncbi:MAG: alanine racemase, partial [Erysipelotrichia bacterium]|nr:alanine racemase [Erysipelotrichia bacterium]
MYRSTWMEVNLDAIMDNVRNIKKICGKKFIAVLKADAYGCGDIQVTQAVLQAGADMLAVSSLDEAMMLRNEKYSGELLILGSTDPADCGTMIENNISAAAYSMQ